MSPDNPGERSTERRPTPEDFGFGRLFRETRDAVAIAGSDDRVLLWNPAAETLFGYTSADAADFPIDDLVPGILAAGSGQLVETEAIRQDGVRLTVEASVSPLDGAPNGPRMLVVRDLTERQETARAVAAEQGMLRLLMEGLPEAVWIKDTESRFVRLNHAAARILGLDDPAEAVGRTDFDFFPESLARQYFADEQRVVRTGEPLLNKMEPQSEDDDGIWWLTSTVPIRDAAGRVTWLLGTGRDVTEPRRAEQDRLRRERAEAAQEAAETGQRRLAFLAEASAILASSLDHEDTLARVAALAVPALADWCSVDLLDPDGRLRQVVVAHADPAKVGLVKDMRRRFPADPKSGYGPPEVARTGRPILSPEVLPEHLALGVHDPDHLRLLTQLGLRSYMAVPLIARGQIQGVIGFAISESDRAFGAEELALAEALAERASLAIDNARLYAEALSSEARWQGAFAGASAGMALVGLDGRWLQVNRALCAITGYDEIDLLRLRFQDLTYPDDLAIDLVHRGRILRGEMGAHQWEKRYYRKDGAIVWVLLSVALIRDRAGAPLHFVAQIQDVTERKQAESAQARLAAIVGAADDAILAKTLDGAITDWNRGAEHLYGYTADEAIGRSVFMLAPPDRLEEAEEFLVRAARGEGIERQETVRLAKDGRRLHVSLSISPLHDRSGKVVGSSTIARDISERKQLELLQRDYLAMVTHDLRTPVTVVRGGAQLLQRRGAYHAATVAAILAQTDRMQRLLDDLADLVQLEEGRLRIRPAPMDLGTLAQREAEIVRTQTPGSRIVVHEPPEPVIGDWDADRLGQVLQNLLGNAVKFQEESGSVEVRIEATATEARVTVADEGPGILPEHLPRMFERFYRAEATGAGGLGLGLYISRMLVEAHGGRIRVESEPGAGSRFIVTLPRDG
ncbi:MAG: PAS domain S-box protein [Thermomicrobiales bacterium]|nr:PAS domain S-box protein [Thermomicrobiales bacterium]